MSKKQMNLLFLKSLIKIKLGTEKLSVLELKSKCISTLKQTDYFSNALESYIKAITRSQFSSFNNRAEMFIKKLHLVYPHDITINLDNINDLKPLYSIEDIKIKVTNIISDLQKMVQK